MSEENISLGDLTEHVRDLRTALVGLCHALGGQPQIDAARLHADLIEICLPMPGSPDTVATELVTLLAESVLQGKANAGRDRKGSRDT